VVMYMCGRGIHLVVMYMCARGIHLVVMYMCAACPFTYCSTCFT
jgi:hypothetical protein